MGTVDSGFSESAKTEFNHWRKENNISDLDSEMPGSFPIPESFISNDIWNTFRAQFLAKWINDDAAAYREIAGENAYIAVDYLDATESQQARRVGDPKEFLNHLSAPNIIQLNWTWYFPTNTVNQKGYDRVLEANNSNNRDWAISEHMTFNGSDFTKDDEETLEAILLNTLNQGTRFGWEFVSVSNDTKGSFSLYNDDWSPKKVIGLVDNHW